MRNHQILYKLFKYFHKYIIDPSWWIYHSNGDTYLLWIYLQEHMAKPILQILYPNGDTYLFHLLYFSIYKSTLFSLFHGSSIRMVTYIYSTFLLFFIYKSKLSNLFDGSWIHMVTYIFSKLLIILIIFWITYCKKF